MEASPKLDLITRSLKEITGNDVLLKIADKRNLNIYWGTATTGKPHIAYFLPIFKIKDFVDAGCNVKILLADIHAFLDNLKAPIEKIKWRSAYYKKLIISMLKSIKVDTSKITFVEGSSFQLSTPYFNDLQRILGITSENDARRAGSEVVKQVGDAKLSSLVYPAMQALDEEYLKVDVQFGGVDQRKIFMYAREFLPLINYKKRIHLMNPMIPGLNSGKMSSSDKASKIDLLDSNEDIKSKIHNCKCDMNDSEDGLLSLFIHILIPFCDISGIDLSIKNIRVDDLNFKKLFLEKKIFSEEVKEKAIEVLIRMIDPVRSELLTDADLIKQAYD